MTQKQRTKLEPLACRSWTNIYWAPIVRVTARGREVGKGRGQRRQGPGQPAQAAGTADLATCWALRAGPAGESCASARLHRPSGAWACQSKETFQNQLSQETRSAGACRTPPIRGQGKSHLYSHSSINISQTLHCKILTYCPSKSTPVCQTTGPGMWLGKQGTHIHHLRHPFEAKLPNLLFRVK